MYFCTTDTLYSKAQENSSLISAKPMPNNRLNQRQRFTILMPLLFAVVLIFGIMLGMTLQSGQSNALLETRAVQTETYPGQGRIEEMLRYIEAKYVDSVDRDRLVNEAIETILEQLDPHSSYISKEELRQVTEQLEGNFEGIGVEFMMVDDTVVVVAPISGGPSEQAGILAGDKIIEVEDSIIAGQGLDNQDIIQLLKGEKGSQVTIGIKRGSRETLRRFTITRAEIPLNSVDVSYELSEGVGFIKISRFSATTDREFIEALQYLVEEQDVKDLIIDLRHNPGGYLQKATNILSQLFSRNGELLVYTQGRAVKRSDYESTGRSFFRIDDVVVLIDEGSASASEILAGAIQDQDRGIIVGRRSFGKGLVQEQYRLSDGSALRLTVARYYTPSGRSIQKPYDDLEGYRNDFQQRYESGELFAENKIDLNDSTRYYTNNGRVVYGGGGIIPDIFVPLDTTLMTDAFAALRQQVPNFVFRYIESHPNIYGNLSLEEFRSGYRLPATLVDDFIAFAAKEDAGLRQKAEAYRSELALFLKARIGKHLFDEVGYYAVIHQDDDMVQKALEVLRNPNPLTENKLFDQ